MSPPGSTDTGAAPTSAALQSLGRLIEEQPMARLRAARSRILAQNPELQERELIKLAS